MAGWSWHIPVELLLLSRCPPLRNSSSILDEEAYLTFSSCVCVRGDCGEERMKFGFKLFLLLLLLIA